MIPTCGAFREGSSRHGLLELIILSYEKQVWNGEDKRSWEEVSLGCAKMYSEV